MPQHPDPRERLARALESGDFVQGRFRLRRHTSTGLEHCCLGVACQLFHEETGRGEWVSGPDADRFEVDGHGHAQVMPVPVMKHFGFSRQSATYSISDEWRITSLVNRNDAGATFEEIAKIIRDAPPELFAGTD